MTAEEVLRALADGKSVRERLWLPDSRICLRDGALMWFSPRDPNGRPAVLTLGQGREYEVCNGSEV